MSHYWKSLFFLHGFPHPVTGQSIGWMDGYMTVMMGTLHPLSFNQALTKRWKSPRTCKNLNTFTSNLFKTAQCVKTQMLKTQVTKQTHKLSD